MDTVFLIIGYLSIPLVLVAVFMMISTLKKVQLVRSRQLLITIAISIAVLLLYEWVLDAERSSWSVLLALGGAVIGGWVATTADLRVVDGDVYATRSHWYLWLWALTFSFAQLTALGVVSADVATGLASMYLATGVAVGLNLVLWNQRLVLLNRVKAAGDSATACPSCGTPNGPAATVCAGCHLHLVPAESAISSSDSEEEMSRD